MLLLVLLVLVVAGLVVAVAAGRIPGGLQEETSSVPVWPLPPGPVEAEDLDDLRFAPALRGYRMDQVDAVLDRVRQELARRDERVAELEAQLETQQEAQLETRTRTEAAAPARPQGRDEVRQDAAPGAPGRTSPEQHG